MTSPQYGGSGGGPFADNIPSDAQAFEVNIRSGAYVDSLQMGVKLPDGTHQYLDKHGGTGGCPDTFTLGNGEIHNRNKWSI
jgi:hypothetical protein